MIVKVVFLAVFTDPELVSDELAVDFVEQRV